MLYAMTVNCMWFHVVASIVIMTTTLEMSLAGTAVTTTSSLEQNILESSFSKRIKTSLYIL